MAHISKDDLRSTISSILKKYDINRISAKNIRNMLEEKYQVDFTPRKQEIDKLVMQLLEERLEQKNKENASSSDSSDSNNSYSDSSDEDLPSPKKIKISKNPTKRNNQQATIPKKVEKKTPQPQTKTSEKEKEKSDSSDSEETSNIKEKGVDDAAIARKLQEEEWNFRKRAVKKLPRENTNKRKRGEENKPKAKKGVSTYARKCSLSPELAEVMQTNEMARHNVVKRMWEIVRERDLFDPSNKQYAFCDEQLKKIFRKKRVRLFGMMKYLKNHIKDVN